MYSNVVFQYFTECNKYKTKIKKMIMKKYYYFKYIRPLLNKEKDILNYNDINEFYNLLRNFNSSLVRENKIHIYNNFINIRIDDYDFNNIRISIKSDKSISLSMENDNERVDTTILQQRTGRESVKNYLDICNEIVFDCMKNFILDIINV